MKSSSKYNRSEICKLAHQFIRMYGVSQAEAMRIAWRNAKLENALHTAIVHFYFQKVDGSIREAYGTLAENRIPAVGENNRKKNDTVQVYFDTEKNEWRCFKKINLVKIA